MDEKEKTKRAANDGRERYMRQAIDLSIENVRKGGGPFGAVIVRDGRVIATGTNRVVPGCDPTAHAEVTAIRNAARVLGTFDLSGCEIYTSCEPCPMCLGAIYWARLDRMYYANDKKDAAEIGFDDSFIYDEFALAPFAAVRAHAPRRGDPRVRAVARPRGQNAVLTATRAPAKKIFATVRQRSGDRSPFLYGNKLFRTPVKGQANRWQLSVSPFSHVLATHFVTERALSPFHPRREQATDKPDTPF